MSSNQTPETHRPIPPSRPSPSGTPSKPKTSPLGRFFRGLLRWVTGIAAVFCLGILAMWLVRVRPQSEQISQMQTQIATLQKEINGPQPQVEILQSLVDVSKAQVALVQGGQDEARQALGGTDARLAKLEVESAPRPVQDASGRAQPLEPGPQRAGIIRMSWPHPMTSRSLPACLLPCKSPPRQRAKAWARAARRT